MKTFNAELKAHWITTMQAHQDADRLMQGTWFDGERGCFFGCAMQTDEAVLDTAVDEMQLPFWLVKLAEEIFEGLPPDEALTFPVRLLKAIPADTDIDPVEHVIAIKRLEGLINPDFEDFVNDAIREVIKCHQDPSNSDWRAAQSAAQSVAWSAAWSAAQSAAQSVAQSVAWSAAQSAAESAAQSAVRSPVDSARSAARSVARLKGLTRLVEEVSTAWSQEATRLIEALENHEKN